MKKTYSKPQILFESFELSQSIASECEYICQHDVDKCPIDLGGDDGTVFTQEINCTWTEPGWKDRVCYHAPMDNVSAFSS